MSKMEAIGQMSKTTRIMAL